MSGAGEARGALALERLSRAEDGRIAYRMKRPLPDGTTHMSRSAASLSPMTALVLFGAFLALVAFFLDMVQVMGRYAVLEVLGQSTQGRVVDEGSYRTTPHRGQSSLRAEGAAALQERAPGVRVLAANKPPRPITQAEAEAEEAVSLGAPPPSASSR